MKYGRFYVHMSYSMCCNSYTRLHRTLGFNEYAITQSLQTKDVCKLLFILLTHTIIKNRNRMMLMRSLIRQMHAHCSLHRDQFDIGLPLN